MDSLLQHSVRVDALTWSRDTSGGNVKTYATRIASTACLVSQGAGRDDRRFDGNFVAGNYTVTTRYASVEPGDRLYVLTGPYTGVYLRVLGFSGHGQVGSITKFYRLKCEELKG
jgi:hypothetical protein